MVGKPDAQLWARAKEVVADAVEVPGETRDAFVIERCAGDEALLREVRSLLAYAGETSSFVDAPMEVLRSAANLGSAGNRDRTGEVLGAWALDREIGRGGMGVVFLAHRADGAYQQVAAVKLLRGGASDPRSVARMQRERQTLAQLTHPNIARLIDGGNAVDGTPYLVMEYIEGDAIDHYCDQQHLSINARIALMISVCAAVQSAHQGLVIHRDLKPSNVLVTRDGTPKLLDFGVARLLEEQGNNSDQTQGALLFTPRYASPEQVRGLPVNVATDVYGLGLLLYDLLAGESPYEQLSSNAATNAAAAMQAVVGDALRKPSEVARVHRPANVDALRGDLDTILLRACAKDASERYATVADLSADLTRYARNLPIMARPPTWGYVASKFVRRHAVGVGLGTFAAVAVVAGFVGTVSQKNRAEAERAKAEARYDQVRDLATRMVTEYNDAIVKLPGGTELRQRMANDAIKQLDTLSRDAPSDPALALQIAQAYRKLASVSYSDTKAHLGDGKAFDASMKKADDILRKALEDSTGTAVVANAGVAGNVANKLTASIAPSNASKISTAPAIPVTAMPAAPKVEPTPPAVAPPPVVAEGNNLQRELELQWGETQKSMASRARATGEYDKAQQLWESVIARYEGLLREGVRDEQMVFYMLDSHYSLAQTALVFQRRSARAQLDAAAKLMEPWIKLSPRKSDLNYILMREMRTSYTQAKFDKNNDAALGHIDREIKLRAATSSADPANVELVREHSQALKERAGFLMQLGKFADALAGQEAALALVAQLQKADPADVFAQTEVMWITRDRGISLSNLDRREEAAAEFEKAFQMCAPMTSTDKTTLTVVRLCTNAAWWTTRARLRAERKEEAKESAKRILATRDKFPQLFENRLEQLWLKNAQEAIAGEPLTPPNVGAPITLPTAPTAAGAGTPAAATSEAKK